MSISAALAESVAPPSVAFERTELVGLSREEIARALVDADIGVAKGKNANMRAAQIWRWIYVQGVNGEDAFASMTNLSIPLRAALERRFAVTRAKIATQQSSVDGTCKWLLKLGDGALVECVYIPEESRGTLCISSQVGCTLNCRFCHTGTQRLARNLTVPEIVGQILVARDYLGEWPTPTFERRLSNIVLMGMGEPLYNFDAVKHAVNVATDGEGLGISRRRVTLSTAGVAPLIPKAGEEMGTSLAISLHATNNKLRDELVPINKKYPIETLLDACRNYPGLSNARRITFEYVLLDGVNDSPDDARQLLRLLKNIPSKINLIPFNPWPGAPYKRSSDSAIKHFAAILQKAGYASPVRTPRGEDIMAACGQLKSTTLPIRRSQQ